MRLIVVGASGYIGRRLLQAAAASGVPTVSTSSKSGGGLHLLDLAQPGQFDFGLIDAGDTVCLAAAISAPDICAREHDRAWALNVTGTTAFAEGALQRGARIVFFSSDTVYGERPDAFDESAALAPAGEYAAMKAEIERRFAGEPNFKSIRLSYIFSRDDKFTRYLVGCAERGEGAEVFDPFLRAVIHRDDVTEGVIALSRRWSEIAAPSLNFGGPAAVSRVEFAGLIQRIALPRLTFTVTTPAPDFFTNRPRAIHMASPLLSQLLGRPLRTLATAISIEFQKEH
jgi:dTDP-4-dehydrorhamnose reductase